MGAQPRIDFLPELAPFRVVVDSFRVEEPGNTLVRTDHPGLGQEALVEVGLHALQHRVILPCIQKILGNLRLFKGLQVGAFEMAGFEGLFPQLGKTGGAEFPEHKQGLVIPHNAPFVPFNLDPWRISQQQIKPFTAFK